MKTTNHRAGRVLSASLFALVQTIVIGGTLAAIGWGLYRDLVPAPLPPLRAEPIRLGPIYNNEAVITDEQLTYILTRLRPQLAGPQTKINHVDHALRFWGLEAQFQDPSKVSGTEMRRLLVDHRRFAELYGDQAATLPLLTHDPLGIQVRVQEGNLSSSHHDHTVATLAEVGTPLDFPVQTLHEQATYRDMVENSLRRFSLNQVEYEWSAMTFAMFVRPTTSWKTSEGQRISFDLLAQRIMRQDQPQGVCFGNHRLYSLVVLLRVDELEDILSDEVHAEVVRYLAGMTARLVAHQHEAGFWNGDWPTARPASREPSGEDPDRLSDRLIATGHALEWWAMIPKALADELHPPRHVLAAAGQWLHVTVEGMSDDQIVEHYTFLSHAGRALALWRGQEPFEVRLEE